MKIKVIKLLCLMAIIVFCIWYLQHDLIVKSYLNNQLHEYGGIEQFNKEMERIIDNFGDSSGGIFFLPEETPLFYKLGESVVLYNDIVNHHSYLSIRRGTDHFNYYYIHFYDPRKITNHLDKKAISIKSNVYIIDKKRYWLFQF